MGAENIDQGFNDSELADIMEEIESLETQAPSGENNDANELEEDDLTGIDLSSIESRIEAFEVEQDKLDELPPVIEEIRPDVKSVVKHEKKEIVPIKATNVSADTQLNFQIQGKMTMDLGFTLSGKTIRIIIEGEKGLELMLPGGMRFSIPLEND